MHVDIPDTPTVKSVALDEPENLFALGYHCRRQILKQFEDRRPIDQDSTRDLTDHERMHSDNATLEQVGEFRIAFAKVVNPD